MAYDLFCSRILGANHFVNGLPCQDYGIKHCTDEYKIFAVADGHGDSTCTRSNIGSEIVCRVAKNELICFAQKIKNSGTEKLLFDDIESQRLIRQLFSSIVENWDALIQEELRANPMNNDDKLTAYIGDLGFADGVDIEKMYGTTLIAGLMTDTYLLLIQQGDGSCTVFDSEGKATQPIPIDERCIGNITTSLCDSDAVQSFRFSIIDLKKNPVFAVFASTDGLENSFAAGNERLQSYYIELMKYACRYSVCAMEEHLAASLSEMSKNGSADDITLAGILDTEQISSHLKKIEAFEKVLELRREIDRIDTRIMSILDGGKMTYLENIYNEAHESYENATKVYIEVETRYDEILSSLEYDGMDCMDNIENFPREISPETALLIEELEQELEEAESSLWDTKEKMEEAEAAYKCHTDELTNLRHLKEELLQKLSGYGIN